MVYVWYTQIYVYMYMYIYVCAYDELIPILSPRSTNIAFSINVNWSAKMESLTAGECIPV